MYSTRVSLGQGIRSPWDSLGVVSFGDTLNTVDLCSLVLLPSHMNISSKHLQNLDLSEVVAVHLSRSPHTVTKDYILVSSLDQVESEMRQTRGNVNTKHYAPALCAFALLDQIGSCYTDKAMPSHPVQGGGAIHRALYYWGGMAPLSPEIEALYAFRNGLVHDGSLTSRTTRGQWYIFRYDGNISGPVKLAQTPWDGTPVGLGKQTLTKINSRALTDLVSDAIAKLLDCHKNRVDDLNVLQTRDDILHKYCFWTER